jgi:hypothetical protein
MTPITDLDWEKPLSALGKYLPFRLISHSARPKARKTVVASTEKNFAIMIFPNQDR